MSIISQEQYFLFHTSPHVFHVKVDWRILRKLLKHACNLLYLRVIFFINGEKFTLHVCQCAYVLIHTLKGFGSVC